jgi:glycosyltransferase involved in cell wall biosynthesis
MSSLKVIDKNNRYLISDRIKEFAAGKEVSYIMNAVDIYELKPNPDTFYVLIGDFVVDIEQLVQLLFHKTFFAAVIKPSNITVSEFRRILGFASGMGTGERPVWPCVDGHIGTGYFSYKGFSISMCFPAWNEAETIQDVIESFLPIADEIIIGIDKKTTDQSREIAAAYADQMHEFTWEKSFAKARNFVMNKCTGDWIFMTEGHEYLHESSIPTLRTLNSLPKDVTFVKVRRYIDYKKHSEFPWICRNNRGAHYINDSHNAVISNIAANNLTISLPDIKTIHDRSEEKDAVRKEQRRFMNRTNLLKAVADNPKDARSMFYLANEYYDYKEYSKAIEWYKRYLCHSYWPDEKYQAKVFLGRCYAEINNIKDSIETFLSCFLEPVPRNDHMIYISDLIAQENPSAALYYLKMACTVDEPNSPMWIDPLFYRQIPLQRLCVLYCELGMLTEALECAEKIKKLYPDTPGVDEIVGQIDQKINKGV